MPDFILIDQSSELTVRLLAIVVSAIGVGVAVCRLMMARRMNLFEALEASSVSQIESNLSEIDRVLSRAVVAQAEPTLQDILESGAVCATTMSVGSPLAILAPKFASFCANLEKYNSNIMPRKRICFRFQEYGIRARKLLVLFEKDRYEDASLGFARLHLKNAGVIL